MAKYTLKTCNMNSASMFIQTCTEKTGYTRKYWHVAKGFYDKENIAFVIKTFS